MQISARNVLQGKVLKVDHGTVNTEVTLQLPGGLEIVSIVTKQAAETLQLSPGKNAHAIIKATSIMVGVD
jgi:molybdopterin-binding protein